MEAYIKSILTTLSDYRKDEGFIVDEERVYKWLNQFPESDRITLLKEMAFTLDKSFIDKQTALSFLDSLLENTKFVTSDPKTFWKETLFLDIQQGGTSQKDLLNVLDGLLSRKFGFGISECGHPASRYLYIDDVVYSGNRVKNDLCTWIKSNDIDSVDVHIVVLAYHTSGQYYASKKITECKEECGKKIKFEWWRCVEVENRLSELNRSDILMPTEVPSSEIVRKYTEPLDQKGHLHIRNVSDYESEYYSGEEGRQFLERVFLETGVKVLNKCSNFSKYIRPYGFNFLNGLGFGSMIVTYRNCPNTVPVAIWADDPWIPLLPRKTN